MSCPSKIGDLAEQLDTLFQNTLDRLESQTRDALIIDKALRHLLEQRATDESILNWDPERAMSPKLAFRSLALRLILQADDLVTRGVAITPLDYEDLLSWFDEPKRTHRGAVTDFLSRIEYARNKTLVDFWHSLQARVAPDRDPALAKVNAVQDLIDVFSIQLPHEYIIPFAHTSESTTIVPLALNRSLADLAWVIQPEARTAIAKANHAMSTVCQVNDKKTYANLILEMNATVHSKLQSSLHQYKPGDSFLAGGFLSMRFQREHIDFRMGKELFGMIHDSLAGIQGLHFVNSPKMV